MGSSSSVATPTPKAPALTAAPADRHGAAPTPKRRFLGLGARVAAAAVFLPCFTIIARRGDIYFVLLVNFVACAGTLEFLRMLEAKGLKPQRGTALLAAIAMPWLAFVRTGLYAEFGLTVLLVVIFAHELGRDRGEPLAHVAGATLCTTYVAWLASHLVGLRELPRLTGRPYELGFHAIGFVFVTTWMADTGAYLVGSLIGRHKLAPRISPGKSVEGAAGGIVAATASGWLFARALMAGEISLSSGALLGALAGIMGLLGDLAESLIKRDAHVKDASGAIPGHGGALDRFDSVLFSAPLLYYVLRFFVL